MVTRAGTSRGASHEVFRSSEQCFLAAFEEGLARLSAIVEQTSRREQRWLGRVRSGLVALLGFLDDEPGWARLLFGPAPVAGTLAFRCQQRVLGVLAVLLDDGSPQTIGELTSESQLTAELITGGVFSLIRARLSDPEGAGGSLVELAPSLLVFIARPYLGEAAATAVLSAHGSCVQRAPVSQAELSVPLPVPVTYRTRQVLSAIANAPRSNNREIASAAGLGDEGQTSHLLRRLAQRGLIEKVRPCSGSRRENAWLLTPRGQSVVALLGLRAGARSNTTADAHVREVA